MNIFACLTPEEILEAQISTSLRNHIRSKTGAAKVGPMQDGVVGLKRMCNDRFNKKEFEQLTFSWRYDPDFDWYKDKQFYLPREERFVEVAGTSKWMTLEEFRKTVDEGDTPNGNSCAYWMTIAADKRRNVVSSGDDAPKLPPTELFYSEIKKVDWKRFVKAMFEEAYEETLNEWDGARENGRKRRTADIRAFGWVPVQTESYLHTIGVQLQLKLDLMDSENEDDPSYWENIFDLMIEYFQQSTETKSLAESWLRKTKSRKHYQWTGYDVLQTLLFDFKGNPLQIDISGEATLDKFKIEKYDEYGRVKNKIEYSVKDGIISGVVDAGLIGAKGGLIREVQRLDPDYAVHLISNLNRISTAYEKMRVSISLEAKDVVPSMEFEDEVLETLCFYTKQFMPRKERIQDVYRDWLKYYVCNDKEEHFLKIVAEIEEKLGKATLQAIPKDSGIREMVETGSKGKTIEIIQLLIAAGGQFTTHGDDHAFNSEIIDESGDILRGFRRTASSKPNADERFTKDRFFVERCFGLGVSMIGMILTSNAGKWGLILSKYYTALFGHRSRMLNVRVAEDYLDANGCVRNEHKIVDASPGVECADMSIKHDIEASSIAEMQAFVDRYMPDDENAHQFMELFHKSVKNADGTAYGFPKTGNGDMCGMIVVNFSSIEAYTRILVADAKKTILATNPVEADLVEQWERKYIDPETGVPQLDCMDERHKKALLDEVSECLQFLITKLKCFVHKKCTCGSNCSTTLHANSGRAMSPFLICSIMCAMGPQWLLKTKLTAYACGPDGKSQIGEVWNFLLDMIIRNSWKPGEALGQDAVCVVTEALLTLSLDFHKNAREGFDKDPDETCALLTGTSRKSKKRSYIPCKAKLLHEVEEHFRYIIPAYVKDSGDDQTYFDWLADYMTTKDFEHVLQHRDVVAVDSLRDDLWAFGCWRRDRGDMYVPKYVLRLSSKYPMHLLEKLLTYFDDTQREQLYIKECLTAKKNQIRIAFTSVQLDRREHLFRLGERIVDRLRCESERDNVIYDWEWPDTGKKKHYKPKNVRMKSTVVNRVTYYYDKGKNVCNMRVFTQNAVALLSSPFLRDVDLEDMTLCVEHKGAAAAHLTYTNCVARIADVSPRHTSIIASHLVLGGSVEKFSNANENVDTLHNSRLSDMFTNINRETRMNSDDEVRKFNTGMAAKHQLSAHEPKAFTVMWQCCHATEGGECGTVNNVSLYDLTTELRCRKCNTFCVITHKPVPMRRLKSSTSSYINRLELARVLGIRAAMISRNVRVLADVTGSSAVDLAKDEFAAGQNPLIIRRFLHGNLNVYEDVSVGELFIIDKY